MKIALDKEGNPVVEHGGEYYGFVSEIVSLEDIKSQPEATKDFISRLQPVCKKTCKRWGYYDIPADEWEEF